MGSVRDSGRTEHPGYALVGITRKRALSRETTVKIQLLQSVGRAFKGTARVSGQARRRWKARFNRLADQVIRDVNPSGPQGGRIPDVEAHMQRVRGELVGCSELAFEVIKTVVRIRREYDLAMDVPYLFLACDQHIAQLSRELNTRWLLALCDTYADHGSESDQACAMMIVELVNGVKLADTERLLLRDARIDEPRMQSLEKGGLVFLWDGVTHYRPHSGDMPRLMLTRMHRVLDPHPVLGEIWRTVFERLQGGNNLLSRLATHNRMFWCEQAGKPGTQGRGSSKVRRRYMEERRILVIGGYHRLNLGDDVLMDVLTRELAPCRLTFTWIGERFTEASLEEFDHVILGGGSHWPARAFSDIATMSRRPPFSIIGISAREAVDADVTRSILDKANAVIVRDSSSRELLQRHPAIRVAPDLSWLHPVSLGGGEAIGLNLRFWHAKGRRCDPVSIGRIVRETGREVIPLPCFHGHPKAVPSGSRTDQEVLREAGVTSMRVCYPESVRRCHVVVSMRYHPTVFAAQAGVPFVAFDDHPKTRAFARMMEMDNQIVPAQQLGAFAQVLRRTSKQVEELAAGLRVRREEQIEQARRVYGEVLEGIRSGAM